ncbi:MAG: S8 family serine peptidase [Planctomycetota bacterium]|jgi:hypothetical protein
MPVGWLVVLTFFAPMLRAETRVDSVVADPVAVEPAYDVFGGVASTHIVVRLRLAGGDAIAEAHPQFSSACQEWGVTAVERLFVHDFAAQELAVALGLDRTYRLAVPEGTDTQSMVEAFGRLVDVVEFAELDGIGGIARTVPDDPDFANQWSLHNFGQTGGAPNADVNATVAWSQETGQTSPVTVAVVDSGVSVHSEFSDRMVPGVNTNSPTTPDTTYDGCPHGTHVAGIIGAEGNNSFGIAGLSWHVNIMPVRVLGGCVGFESQCADGIVWAVDHGADICNMSLQYYKGTQVLRDAVQYAQQSGVLLVAAAGNSLGNLVAYPARYEECIAVSATDHSDNLYDESNYGSEIELAAPGENILSTWTSPTNSFVLNSGTSMAAPHVTGLAALMMSRAPELSAGEIRQIIIDTALDLGSVGRDNLFGYGRINAGMAMAVVTIPTQVGACCGGEGGCFVSFETDCAGAAWHPEHDCTPLPCALEPEVAVLGQRYLEITPDPGNGVLPVAIMVDSNDWNCGPRYVSIGDNPELVETAQFQAADQWGAFSLADSEIVPGTEYRVRAEYGSYGSNDIPVTTWGWGDVDHSGVVNFTDILLAAQVFQGQRNMAGVETADNAPCTPNGLVNFEDILRTVQAFQGMTFDVMNCANPCF